MFWSVLHEHTSYDETDEQIHDMFHCLSLGFNIVAKLLYNGQIRQSKTNNDNLDLMQLYEYSFIYLFYNRCNLLKEIGIEKWSNCFKFTPSMVPKPVETASSCVTNTGGIQIFTTSGY